ncbi:MAG TPA: EAL domain-containing protein [Acidimicrobiia bacterium]|jgi:diguanylate cyclase (GGDEF)-like protein
MSQEAPQPNGRSVRGGARPDAGIRVAILSAALLVGTGLLAPVVAAHPVIHANGLLPPWLLVALFAACAIFTVEIEIRREAHAFTFSEIPLTIALYLASPVALVVSRAIGEMAVVVPKQRSARKVMFNFALFTFESVAALAVFGLLCHTADITQPRTWLAAVAAVLTADVVGWSSVSTVIAWHGGEREALTTMVVGVGTAVANTSLALAASLLIHFNSAAAILLVVIGGVLYAAYHGYSALAQRYASLHLLYDFTRAVSGARRAESVLTAILEQVRRALRADIAEIMLVGLDGERCLRMRLSGDSDVTSEMVDAGGPFWSRVVEGREALLVTRPGRRRGGRSSARAELLIEFGVRDLAVAPLYGEEGVAGYLLVADRLNEGATFDSGDGRLLEALANHAAVALENGRLVDRVAREVREREYQAAHDALTGLANRTSFVDRVRDALGRGQAPGVGVMLMDLDRFKDVNDTLGHDTGDEVLSLVASRLSGALGDSATVARLGGDEFAILVPGIADVETAHEVAAQARSVLVPPFALRGVSLEIAGSIGITVAPLHGTDAHTLLKRADIAMYSAKREPSGIAVYDAETDENTVTRLALVGALREAIDHQQLQVYYQPKVRISDERVVGAEALVRWFHPEHGFMSPDVFVAIAERTGLIGSLTRLVAREAIAQCKEWNDNGYDMSIAVNLSALGLLDMSTPDLFADLLAEIGLEPSKLTLEITETTIMEPARSVAAIERLAALGVRLSIDDFGTGYSSLSHLQRLPVQEIKVDRSFVMTMGANESDVAIVKSIVDLGHNLGLKVVAEGVEDRVSWDLLARQCCDIAQGYFMSRPIPADAFNEWLQGWEPRRIEPITQLERAVTAIGHWR